MELEYDVNVKEASMSQAAILTIHQVKTTCAILSKVIRERREGRK